MIMTIEWVLLYVLCVIWCLWIDTDSFFLIGKFHSIKISLLRCREFFLYSYDIYGKHALYTFEMSLLPWKKELAQLWWANCLHILVCSMWAQFPRQRTVEWDCNVTVLKFHERALLSFSAYNSLGIFLAHLNRNCSRLICILKKYQHKKYDMHLYNIWFEFLRNQCTRGAHMPTDCSFLKQDGVYNIKKMRISALASGVKTLRSDITFFWSTSNTMFMRRNVGVLHTFFFQGDGCVEKM